MICQLPNSAVTESLQCCGRVALYNTSMQASCKSVLETLGVLCGPCPLVTAHVLHIQLRLPTKHLAAGKQQIVEPDFAKPSDGA
jgi:hypothetical protein